MLAEKNQMIGEAYCKLQEMSEDEANRMIYEARLKAQRDEYSRVQGALKKGWEEGMEEGMEKGMEKVARILKSLGDPIEKIARATGLSADEIAAL